MEELRKRQNIPELLAGDDDAVDNDNDNDNDADIDEE